MRKRASRTTSSSRRSRRISDAQDQCPDTPAGSIVNAQGCSLQQLVPCDSSWPNHGEYVEAMIRRAWESYRHGLITPEQRRIIIRLAARSDCGRQGMIAEKMRLHSLPLTPEECRTGGMQWVVSGGASADSLIETSTDLVHWATLQTISPTAIGDEMSCAYSSAEPTRFLRLRSTSSE